jgi:hypothetical protein
MTESIQGLTELQKRLSAITDTHKLLGTIGLLAVARAKEIVPRKTGNLGRTIRLGQITDTQAQIIAGGQAGVGYAQAVEFGTKAHDITPRLAQALSWPASGADARLSGSVRSGGKRRFAKKVHHPGTKAQPYLMPGAQAAVKEAGVDVIVRAWNEAA